MADITVHLDDELYDKASRVARLDNVSVKELVEDVMRRHLDYVEVVQDFSKMPPLALENYELHRDADESDEDYAFRRSLCAGQRACARANRNRRTASAALRRG
ncbi:hypothetical protein [Bradyrhizobium sp. TM233]|uniref:hypothetical protein n=1 Tax=Bradyrhizobium sp. TM233 TaxID=2599801 RepID=UPI0027D6842B|nr:hypothetical protein TM233_35670 [Bradyrhizobium sp. TM233]